MNHSHAVTAPQRFELTRHALIEETNNRTFIYGRWDRIFGAWMRPKTEKPTIESVPTYPLLAPDGDAFLSSRARIAEAWKAHEQSTFQFAGSDEHPIGTIDENLDGESLSSASEYAFIEYVEAIPKWARRLAKHYGLWQWCILDGLRHVQKFDDFVGSELRYFGPAYISACLALGEADKLNRKRRWQLIEAIMYQPRAALLTKLSNQPWSKRSINLLKKMPSSMETASDFERILRISQDAEKHKHLSHHQRLTSLIVRAADQLPVWACPHNIQRLITSEELLQTLDWQLTRLDLSLPKAFIELASRSLAQVHDESSLWAFANHPDRWLFKGHPFAKPPIPGDNTLLPLTTRAAMRREARQMHNCLRDLILPVLTGDRYFYKWLGAECATVELRRYGDLWDLGEVLGVHNEPVTEETLSLIQSVVYDQLPWQVEAE
tara:strand:+ start:542 stop:1846 length:1305 start_codon:yes stop_codon:yes gene_type:complete